jgi:hypothetical protein
MSMSSKPVSISDLPIDSDNRCKTHAALEKEICLCANDLSYLAKAFFTTGNVIVGKQLYEIASALSQVEQKLSELHGAETSDLVKHATQATDNMMRAVFAGVEIANKGNKKEK